MLVLSRVHNETICVGENAGGEPLLEVTIVSVNPRTGRVRLGFKAPETLKIHRKEVWLQIAEDKSEAAAAEAATEEDATTTAAEAALEGVI